MKNFILALLVCSGLTAQAQRKIQKEAAYNNESVEMAFDLASSIEVRTWKKPSIVVEASAETKDPEQAERFDINLTKEGKIIRFESNAKELYGVNEDNNFVVKDEEDFDFNYIIYVPEGVQLKVSSIIGSLNSDYLNGDIFVDLITGNIDIKKFEGDLKLKTITGKINMPVKNSSFKAKTVMGQIYANADSRLQTQDHIMGQEMSLDAEETDNHLSLNTVTGDIYLR